MEVKLNRIRAHTIFPQSLRIYEDVLVFRKRKWFVVDEMTITYNHVAQANLKSGIWFATLQIITSGGFENPHIPHVLKKHAKKAKAVIDQKIYRVHDTGSSSTSEFSSKKETHVDKFEKSLNRLNELLKRGQMSQKEYDLRRKRLIKRLE